MNENENKSGSRKMILGGVALIIVLFAAVKLVFWGLGMAVPQTHLNDTPAASVSQSASAGNRSEVEAPSFCVHCGKALPDSFQWGQFCPWCGEKVE